MAKIDPELFDPSRFVLDGEYAHPELNEEVKASNEAYRQKLERLFVKAPFLQSMRMAKDFRMPVMMIWIELLRISFSRRGQNPVRLSNAYLRLNPKSKREALQRMELKGYIRVVREKGKSPLVTIIGLPLKDKSTLF
jgi:hypothetical protein